MAQCKKCGKFSAGIYVDSKGYLAISRGPMRGWRVHRVIALAKYGKRATEKDAVIHHIDGDKLNCHPDNLQLMTEREHNAVSAKQREYLKVNVWPREKAEWEAMIDGNGSEV